MSTLQAKISESSESMMEQFCDDSHMCMSIGVMPSSSMHCHMSGTGAELLCTLQEWQASQEDLIL